MNQPKYKFATNAIHAGQEPEQRTGSVMVPIFQTSTYAQKSPGVHSGYEYARTHNPTRQAYEECVASLENAKYGIAFSSGLAATSTWMQTLSTGDHIISSDDVYGGTNRLFHKVYAKQGFEFSLVDLTNPENFIAAIKPNTKWLWLESPTNPTLKILDIALLSKLAHEKGIKVAVDNTFMSPYFQKPLDLGADAVVHSATKYINGHSDVVGGIFLTNNETLANDMRFLQNAAGAVPAPLDCFLILRGLKTLHLRMDAHQKNAFEIANFLVAHPKVEKVIYPGLPSHPQHAIAKKQMTGFGGMITFFIKGGLTESRKFLESVKIITLAESLGGVESLVEHPAIMTHASVPVDQRAALGISDNLIRLSVGVEDIDDLKNDLNQALSKV